MTHLSISSGLEIPLDEFEFTYARSGGPGGQNVNKVNSKAVLRWSVTASPSLPEDVRERFLTKYASRLTSAGELILTSQKYRDQARNVEDCLEKLRQMITAASEPPTVRRPTRISRAAKQRRAESKQKTSQKKEQRRSLTSYD
jgi:ribosome-associated protein